MTAGNTGSDTPGNDDPFGYLYRSEGGEGGAGGDGATRQQGVPRTSYNQVRAVGERQYGGASQQSGPGRQNASYAAPETLPGGERARTPQAGPPAPPQRNHKGLLIGAVAVVGVVCIAIGIAMLNNSGKGADNKAQPSETVSASEEPEHKPTEKPSKTPLPKDDAGSLKLGGTAATSKDIPGARSAGGVYVGGMNTPGASATWTLNVEEPGAYKMWVGYGVPGKDQNLTLTVNDKRDPRPLNMGNFANAEEGAWDKWTSTWQRVPLNKGTNTVTLSCEDGNKCDVNIDQLWLEKKIA
ncbi:carbohydrate-binding protein [Streptomyces benahoarensis]|uniref:Carbohydrate-binding protein n=1 Tax=Streptomyces benahoarensis TaxID=2595054 RepID=A0A553ZFY1_9ACTN|nr:carbohydrate-binding protein [Streptomyces benahoarensis]TSB21459.1 carbohydrate-binding protein [Streptomyces benahoarensis]TSB40310.1 carbohydrate-binding protein [Streptomyces benahoarensis]